MTPNSVIRAQWASVLRELHGTAEVSRWTFWLSTNNRIEFWSYHFLCVKFVLRIVRSSIGRDTIIFYACTMEVWHISSYFVIRTRLKDDIWPHLTLFRLFCDPDRGQDDIWPHLTQFNTSRDRGQVENCAIEPCLTSLTHLKRHEW